MSKAKQILKASKKWILPVIQIWAIVTCLINDNLFLNALGVLILVLILISEAISNQLIKGLKEKISIIEDSNKLFCKEWRVPYNSTLSKSTDKTIKITFKDN